VDGLDKLMSSIIFMNAKNPLVMPCLVNGPLHGIPSRFLFHNFVGDNLAIHWKKQWLKSWSKGVTSC